jgi:serine/threonine-protein kinase HipA
MSIAGAQHKLLVIYEDGQLFEPEGATPSTHILKPNHQQPEMYPASVFNEYLTMRLARALRLDVPNVWMLFVPEPVYIIERFDRQRTQAGGIERLHIVDACQLLNKDRLFKHTGATLQALGDVIEKCTNKAAARRNLFSWLVFNVLVANDDCHLKNLSFRVSADGVYLAPHYDLLSTGAHHTRAVAGDHGTWPRMPLAIKLPGADFLDQVTRASVLEAGAALGIPARLANRIVSEMAGRLLPAAQALVDEIAAQRAQAPPAAAGSQGYLARILLNMVYPETVRRLLA